MKVLVVGANGQIGQHLIHLLKGSDTHSARAMVRKEEQVEKFKDMSVEAVLADLEGSVDDIVNAAEGCDAIVFAAGSGGNTGADKTILIDLDGAAKTIEAAEQAGVERFIMVSSMLSNDRDKWGDSMSYYMAAKHHADKILERTDLNYTIIRPGMLNNEAGTGNVEIAKEQDIAEVPREDIAQTIYYALGMENTFKRSFDVVAGGTPIKDALNGI